ncbi:hypothetical protein DRO58_08095 [Candidatus Bathyarchaeota archaeon]|nr:MAG: hypothetical protein DRO58_08095 [Candidatus Bathyarchaeota archaeon]
MALLGRRFKIACVQFDSVGKAKNRILAEAEKYVSEASARGCRLICFPEYFPGFGSVEDLRRLAEPIPGSLTDAMSDLAKRYRVYLAFGMVEESGGKLYDTAVISDSEGKIVLRYRKIHLFDALNVRESQVFEAGDSPSAVLTVNGWHIAVSICYDIRFPELTRLLAVRGMNLLLVPSAWFSGPFKEAHLETILKARALENGVYVAASCQIGGPFTGGTCIVDPYGIVVARGLERPCLVTAWISLDRVDHVREVLPMLTHRRPEVYEGLL